MQKKFRLHRIVFHCVCVPMTKQAYIVIEKALREIFVLKSEGVSWNEEPAQ